MTPTPTPLDLAALRVIAEGATEGPWRIYTVTDSGGRSAAVETAWAHDEQGEDTELVTDWCSPEDAAHIVAFDPPTALALLDRVTAAESSLARYIVQRTRFGDAMAAAAVPAVVDAIMRELTADSDKRAREATARAERAEAVFERVEQQALGAEANLEAALKVSRERLARAEAAEANHQKAERKANDLFDEGIRQKKRAIAAEAKLAAVQEVHALEHCDKWGRRSETPQGLGGWCNSCGTFKGDACPTIAALDTHTPETETP